MQLFFMFLPIVASLIILIYALKKGFDRTAFYISAAVAMVIAMFMMKHNATWYGLLLALTVPLAVSYLIICLFLSWQEDRRRKSKENRVEILGENLGTADCTGKRFSFCFFARRFLDAACLEAYNLDSAIRQLDSRFDNSTIKKQEDHQKWQ